MANIDKPPAPPARPRLDDSGPPPMPPEGSGVSAPTAHQPAPTGWVGRLESFVGSWRNRRLRDARLLDLGALVFELHRQGRREPELLRAKAAAVEELAAFDEPGAVAKLPSDGRGGQVQPDDARGCIDCQEALAPGQLACLCCGSRVAVGEPRPDRLPLLGLATVVVLVGLVCFGFALSELTSDDTPVAAQDELVLGAADPDPRRDSGEAAGASEGRDAGVAGYTAAGGGATAGGGAPGEAAVAAPDEGAAAGADEVVGAGGDGGEAAAGGANPSGAGSTGERATGDGAAGAEAGGVTLGDFDRSNGAAGAGDYTVVLLTSSDDYGARRVAQEAARSGLDVSLLRSDDYADLGEGLWIVATGRHSDRAQAERRATKLGERYPGAYPQRLEPAQAG